MNGKDIKEYIAKKNRLVAKIGSQKTNLNLQNKIIKALQRDIIKRRKLIEEHKKILTRLKESEQNLLNSLDNALIKKDEIKESIKNLRKTKKEMANEK